MMDKWQMSRYLIDAKKAVDTILFLAQYSEKVSMINIREKVIETRRKFYVNACVVLDKCFPKKKKEICKNSIIDAVYYERDKNAAHKDDDYIRKEYNSLNEMAEEMKLQVGTVREVCAEFLPEGLTLDFLIFDSELFRLANGVTKEKEEAIWNMKYPSHSIKADGEEGEWFKVFSDTEDIKCIPEEEKNRYATILKCGICMEETLQNLQDSCIRINVLYRLDMWVSLKQEGIQQYIRLKELGILDIYDLPKIPQNRREARRIERILEEEGLLSK